MSAIPTSTQEMVDQGLRSSSYTQKVPGQLGTQETFPEMVGGGDWSRPGAVLQKSLKS